uniref:Variant surface glycoprotein (VSG), putative n=1 Tax=Trypanosoma brucei TaxID=5691 RepID=Q57UE3_9TRYP|nr:variant surface glycoprotein (VSG), putative [Trypanosoma brucei]
MWKNLLGLIVGVVSMVMTPASCVEQEIVNEGEFKTLCEFVSLTQRISSSLEVKGKSGVNMASLQKMVTDVLFGTDIDDVNNMKWEFYRQKDCGQDSGTQQTEGGKALVRDLVCLCERSNLQPPHNNLCYAGNSGVYQSNKWQDPFNRGKTWNRLQTVCAAERGNSMPTEAEFREKKKQFKERIKERKGNAREHLYTYGGGKEYGLQTCSGTPTQNDGICVLYPRGSDGDNASGIKWLVELERLVKEVEKITKDEGTSKHTKPSSDGEPSMDAKPNSNLKPSTEGGSPTERSDEPRENRNPDAQTTTTTETQTGLTTPRPPEEQKSSAKIILQSIWVFLFWLFV